MDGISMKDTELLKYAVENGIIDTALVQQKIEMHEREEILKQHPYDIYQGKDLLWYTYLPDEVMGRKKVKRKTERAVQDRVVSFYKERKKREKEKALTIEAVYNAWTKHKLTNGEVQKQTIDRYDCDFNKYFSEIRNLSITTVNGDRLEQFVDESISDYEMNLKQFSNFRIVLYGIFKYAKKRKYVDFSISEFLTDMEISPKRFKKIVTQPLDQVYSKEEKTAMEDYLTKNLDVMNLALLLAFKTGLRVGELAALKKEDIINYTVYINRTEIRYKDDDGKSVYAVRDYPKSEAGIRFVVLPEKYKWIIDKCLTCAGSEYLFMKDGHRIRTYSFRRRLNYTCEAKINMKAKSPHKVRKTYGTILLDGKVSESTILNSMGHVDLKCTRDHYYYDRNSIEEKRMELSRLSEL